MSINSRTMIIFLSLMKTYAILHEKNFSILNSTELKFL